MANDHYKPTKDVIERLPPLTGALFCLGNIVKYYSRVGLKASEPFERELNKAEDYRARLNKIQTEHPYLEPYLKDGGQELGEFLKRLNGKSLKDIPL